MLQFNNMETTDSTTREIFAAALRAADPAKAAWKQGRRIRSLYHNGGYSRLFVIGFGKAAVPMAQAMEETLGDIIEAGTVITKYGHAARHGLKKIRVYEAGHPVPDENGLKGTEEILRMVEVADAGTMVVALISGGGSALFVSPLAEITLEEKRETTELLLAAGASKQELNAVRKHISRVKGGRLAELLYPATTLSLILSDVIGDRLDVIASGPTSPDYTTFGSALETLKKFGLMDHAPQTVVNLIKDGVKGLFPETPKGGEPIFGKIENIIIGNNILAVKAAKCAAEARGIRADILSTEISGEAGDAGKWLARKALAAKLHRGDMLPVCLISGGETTVTITGTGKGGRNMELALVFALEIEGTSGITLLSAGTDGTDGSTDAAGAIVDGSITVRARNKGIWPEEYLLNNDSYTFFRKAGGLFTTGPTRTNVMDMQIVVIR